MTCVAACLLTLLPLARANQSPDLGIPSAGFEQATAAPGEGRNGGQAVYLAFEDELRISTTPLPAMNRRRCLLQDPIYRNHAIAAAQACDQPPMLSASLDGGVRRLSSAPNGPRRRAPMPIEYPPARRDDTVDVLHGVAVADPYRWLEEVDSPETAEWVKRENRLTQSYLKQTPGRDRLRRRLRALWNYERFGAPVRRGERYFLTRNDGLQDQDVLYWMTGLGGEMHCLLDPNTLSRDRTVSLADYSVSDDGRYLAYALADAGSDWMVWHVREVASGTDLPDEVRWVKWSSAAWTHDGKGFFYGGYDEPAQGAELEAANYNEKLHYHVLGTPQAQDRLILERPDQPEWGFSPLVSDDGRYLEITVSRGTDPECGIFIQDLVTPNAPVIELLKDLDAAYEYLGNVGTVFYIKTDLEAPNSRIIAIDLQQPEREQWREVVPESADAMESAYLVADRFLVTYLHDACSVAKAYRLDGTFEREIGLPGLGWSTAFVGRQTDREAFYSYADFATPEMLFRYDVEAGESTVFRQPTLSFDPADFVTERVFYPSKDGTRVPMFICRKKETRLSAETPCRMYGYGGFGAAMTPAFAASILQWMELGGIFAQPSIRGGGEYGRAWYDAGRKLLKQNCFDDFIAAAEWLVARGYTSAPKIVISGSSNGGLLVGACLVQRPDLFGACLVDVGVLDMLRFERFTIGWAWTSDYGSPDDPDEFGALLAYSPYHNVKAGTHYPPTLITTADHDDRVFPAHSFKFAAALQAAQAGDAPILIRVETRAGHGRGTPMGKLIEEQVDRTAFALRALGVTEP